MYINTSARMKFCLLTLLFGCCSFLAMAQSDTSTAVTENQPSKNTLTIGTVYANNASYYGQKSIEKTPYLALAANYKLKSGFYLSGLTYRLLNDNSTALSAFSLGAGANFNLTKSLSADISYNHSFYPANSPMLSAGNPDLASVSLTLTKWLTFTLTGDYAFGKTSDQFATGGISKNINLFNISPKDIITITPSADVVAGTQHFYQTYVTQKAIRDSILGRIIPPVLGGGNQGNNPTTKTVTTTSFNLISYNFKIPLAYNRAHYMIETAYQYSLLSEYAQSNAGKGNSFFTLSFYYQF